MAVIAQLLYRPSRVNALMKITVYTITWNEEKMLPHFLHHYSFANKIVIIDNDSTDNTVSIAKSAPRVEVRRYYTRDQQDNRAMRQVKNTCWKGDDAEWVIVCDVDEFLIGHEKLSNYHEPCIFKPTGYNMICDHFPDDLTTIKKGSRAYQFDKCICFSPKIPDINFDYGAHKIYPTHNFPIVEGVMKLYHYNFLGEDYLVERWKRYASRMSYNDKRCGYGKQYLDSEESLREMCRRSLEEAIDVPN